MNLIREYLMLATEIVSFDKYGNEIAVDEYNRKTTRMREIVAEIEQNFPDLKNEFCQLLYHENRKVRLWSAHHALEVLCCEKTYRKAALKEIRYQARMDKTANSFGERLWLKEWYKTHPKDRWV